MARQTTEPLTVEQAKLQLREVAAKFAVPQTVIALLAGLAVGYSRPVRRLLLSGAKRLIRAV